MPQAASVEKAIVIIGTPIDHVRSPDLINPLLRKAGVDAVVGRKEVTAAGLSHFIAETRSDQRIAGLIVTMPLKQAICAYLDNRTPLVSLIGAANCIRFEDGRLHGANFDGFGFVAALDPHEALAPDCSVLLVGCGGAGTAIAASLASLPDMRLLVHDTDEGKAAALVQRISAFAPGSRIFAIPTPVAEADIIVNATPLGMEATDPSPVPESVIAGARLVADIVARPDSALKRAARQLGKPLLDGGAMVSGQGALLWRFILGAHQSERDVLLEQQKTMGGPGQ